MRATAEPIRVEVEDLVVGRELVELLARHGLSGNARGRGGRIEVVIVSEREETERLFREVAAALEGWLAEQGRSSMVLRVGDRETVLA